MYGNPSEDQIKSRILRTLYRKRIWGAKHTAFEQDAPPEMRGMHKEVARLLVKERLLIPKITRYGLQISLNPHKSKEIVALLELFPDDE